MKYEFLEVFAKWGVFHHFFFVDVFNYYLQSVFIQNIQDIYFVFLFTLSTVCQFSAQKTVF